MKECLFAHVNLPPQQAHIPNGASPQPKEECHAYEEAIAGAGHFRPCGLGYRTERAPWALTEPGTELQANVHVANLSAETRRLAYDCWSESAPKSVFPPMMISPGAINYGYGDNPEGRAYFCCWRVERAKRRPFSRAMKGALTPQVPASFSNSIATLRCSLTAGRRGCFDLHAD